MSERTVDLSVSNLPTAERSLSDQDGILRRVICSRPTRWPVYASEDPIWGLVRIVMAQQISTRAACRIAERAKYDHPSIMTPTPGSLPSVASLRALGLSERRSQCCVDILKNSDDIRARIKAGQEWDEALSGIKGIGPWTMAVFRIMVLREPDVLPLGDVGLQRAVANVYGPDADVGRISEKWRPFRSVACWYLWRTLGNEQLG